MREDERATYLVSRNEHYLFIFSCVFNPFKLFSDVITSSCLQFPARLGLPSVFRSFDDEVY